MTLDQIRTGDHVFIDANIFIYNFGGQSTECRDFLIRCAKNDVAGYTLTSVLAEVLHRLMIAEAVMKGFIPEKNPLKLLGEKPEIIRMLFSYAGNVEKISNMNIRILPLTEDIIRKSARIRRSEGLLTNDSLVVAAVKDLGLNTLASNDGDFDHIRWLRVAKPSDLAGG
ncbi:MAG: PIN domain-containing protein [Nitrospiraceae bacterium]|nr:PIN domain-containing protein [Nitrospiraceae bacterium]